MDEFKVTQLPNGSFFVNHAVTVKEVILPDGRTVPLDIPYLLMPYFVYSFGKGNLPTIEPPNLDDLTVNIPPFQL